MKKLGVILLAITMGSCMNTEPQSSKTSYFDLETFISEFPEGSKVKSSIKKTVKLNETVESKKLSNYDISKELAMLTKYNINKASLSGKYSVQEEGQRSIYTAMEDDLITRELIVDKNNGVVSKIEIKGLQKSILSETKQSITFIPNESFEMISEDKNKYNKDLKKEVLIEY